MYNDIKVLEELQSIEKSLQAAARERKCYQIAREWGKAATVTRNMIKKLNRLRVEKC